ncbi:hypothetical protein KAU11_10340 [Candidatus Babeliales bacterium]|nr:hypothetical protein [Candidatus Babeliales bacterium]
MKRIARSIGLLVLSGATAGAVSIVEVPLFQVWMGIVSLVLLVGAIAELSE